MTLAPAAASSNTLVEEWLSAYPNANTRRLYANHLRLLVEHANISAPEDATEAQVIAWATREAANNTIRSRITVALSFYGWCEEQGHRAPDMTRLRRLKRGYPKLYGKTQSQNPARWLTHEEAFGKLVPACQDGTLVGLRDELIIRFGLAGMRRTEIIGLTWRNLASLPSVEWMGKGNRARRINVGRSFLDVLERWRDHYPDPDPVAPVICRTAGTNNPRIDWGTGYRPGSPCLHRIITTRAQKAGLGHVAPHDLRRTAAGILHTATDESGAHFFDLLDIQKVLGHSDPATTMRSYLDPMDNGVQIRASSILD